MSNPGFGFVGDSLLFACGALAAMGTLDFPLLLAIFITSAFLGDTVNYAAGNFLGSKALEANIIKKVCAMEANFCYDESTVCKANAKHICKAYAKHTCVNTKVCKSVDVQFVALCHVAL